MTDPYIQEYDEKTTAARQQLKALSLQDRIVEVSKDIQSNTNRYKGIDAHDLAYLLGIEDPCQPGGDWTRFFGMDKEDFEFDICLDHTPEAFENLKGAVSEKRYSELEEGSDLTDDEVGIIEKGFDYEALFEKFRESSPSASVQINTKEVQGHVLPFEGTIEDDGSCIYLSTPYDLGIDGLSKPEDFLISDFW